MPIAEEISDHRITYTYQISDSTVESHIENIFQKLSLLSERYKDHLRDIVRKRDKIKFLIDRSDKNQL